MERDLNLKKLDEFLIGLLVLSGFTLVNSSTMQGQETNKITFTGYGDASYSGLIENEFLKNWLILDPVKINSSGANPDNNAQKNAFDQDPFTKVRILQNKSVSKIKIDKTECSWKSVKSDNDVVDFVKLFGQVNYAIAYAAAEIKMDAPSKVWVGAGSDDGIKIFLNGKIVHTNWIARGIKQDDDVVELDLNKGSNQLLVKVQNIDQGWGFEIRRLGKDKLANLFVESAGNGNLDDVKMLLNTGIDINHTDEAGLSAYQYAMVRGRETIMSLLKEKGAKTDLPLPGLEKFISNVFKNVQQGTVPGAAVLVAQNGDIIYQNGFGYADVGNKIPVTPDFKFRIGSISKQFTAVAILKLQEEGKISVQDKLSKYIPDFPRGDQVTIYHLLTHTSGIHSYENQRDFLMLVPISPKALVDSIKTFPYDFNPGEKYQYNNSGYFILAYLVEKISGKTLGEYLNETFFKPLGMNNTGIYESSIVLNNEAYGYSMENGVVKKAPYQEMTWAFGVGGIYSTVKDLYKWNKAIFDGKILSEASLKAAFTPAVLNNNDKVDYGYGWFLSTNRGIKFVQHSGGVFGFSSYLERQPENKLTVCVLCNSLPTPDGINPVSNGQFISEFILYNKMEKESSFAIDATISENILKKYVGRYNYGQGRIMKITLEGKQLYGQLSGQAKIPLTPYSTNEFYLKPMDVKLEFFSDDSGIVTHLIHYQNDQYIEARKLKDETPVKVNPAIFDKLTGKYDLGNNYIIEIIKENNKLYVQSPNLPGNELLPASELEYFSMESTTRVNFILNKDGKAESMITNIDGYRIQGKRVGD
jgi:CubicO group peptidase (beta-lactamase class C family)